MQRKGRKTGEWLQRFCGQPFGPADGPRIDSLIQDQLAQLPDIRSELVVPLRTAIEENRYYVPEEQVAERIIFRCMLAYRC